MDSDIFEYRAPINLDNRRLRVLAAALSPAYVRVSGTWANSTYFPLPDEHLLQPPRGFNNLLTREQWKGVVDFARAVDASIVTSFATSQGTRDQNGIWTPSQGIRVLEYTHALGGNIAAAEFMNEPTLAVMGGAPQNYNAAAYGKDFSVFHAFARERSPGMTVLGPGSVGETTEADPQLSDGSAGFIATRNLLRAGGNDVDGFSYHHYGAASKRCTSLAQTTAQAALSEEWLSRTDQTLAFYKLLRDEFAPGKPLWVTETAESACGGNLWASNFLDTFRYVDQLGRLAKSGVKVVMHNTLAASDYALLNNDTYAPRPSYWAALLWRRLMGTIVLNSGIPTAHGLHVYAHCMRGNPGGVTLLVINTSRTQMQLLVIPVDGQRYTLSSSKLESEITRLNGTELRLDGDVIPPLQGARSTAGAMEFAPATISFVTLPAANNSSCQRESP